ncbi:hypothetical protein GCM10023340_37600 [Nocardioides marinquilinus]|uniref:DUF1905 domain-containing protein n=1 Tax=Nocardioides marinquilinus TaxID=1210400 RepID=A0ABP9PYQ9_9ACTN
MSETVQTFRTTLRSTSGTNVGIVVPDEVVAAFGRGKRVPVVVTVDDGYSYRNTISSMGGRFLISFNAETRAATGLGGGDEATIRLEVDDAPRTVEVPDALATALAPSRRKAHATSVADARTDETRTRRVEKILTTLRDA